VAVARLQSLAHESEIDVAINEPQQMIFGNMIFDSEVVKYRLRTSLVAHHNEQRASVYFGRGQHQEFNKKTHTEASTSTQTFHYGIVFGIVARSCFIKHFPG
jgi:hypothetical protein